MVVVAGSESGYEDNSNLTLAKFKDIRAVVVHQSTGDIYVIDRGQMNSNIIRRISTGETFVILVLDTNSSQKQ